MSGNVLLHYFTRPNSGTLYNPRCPRCCHLRRARETKPHPSATNEVNNDLAGAVAATPEGGALGRYLLVGTDLCLHAVGVGNHVAVPCLTR
jgi:hypothetical protein